jgi:hypothetical protein
MNLRPLCLRSASLFAGALLGLLLGPSTARAEGAEKSLLGSAGRLEERRVAAVEPGFYTDAAPTPPEDPDSAAAAKKVTVGYQVETGVATSSVFRGRPLYTTKQDGSSQTNLALNLANLGPGTLGLGVWNATALGGFAGQPGTALEFDVTASYTVKLPASFELGLGYIGYLYPKHTAEQPVDGAHELFATLAHDNPILSPKLSVYGEVRRQVGVYASLALAHAFTLGPVSITPQGSAGFAAYRLSDVPAQLNDVTASLAVQWQVYGPLYVASRAAWSWLAGPDASMPAELRPPSGRSVPWALFAIGAQK